MFSRLVIALLCVTVITPAHAAPVVTKSATFVPGKITVAARRTGISSLGAAPEQRFDGCVQSPTRILFGTSQQLGFVASYTDGGLQDTLTLVLEAKRAAAEITVSYVVAANGYCYYRSVTY